MKYTNFFDKMACLFKIIGSSSVYPIFLGMLVLLTIVLISKKIKDNKVIVLMIISYLMLFIITISNHSRSLSKVFDSIATNLFSNIYFPSTQVYLFTLLIIDIITITSMLNKKLDKAYRIANGICFFATKFVMALILDVVGQKKIDVFSKKSLFSNTDLVILLEISIGIFILWLVSLVVIYVTNLITNYLVVSSLEKKRRENEYLSSLDMNEDLIFDNKLHVEEPVYDTNIVNENVYAVSDNEVSNVETDTYVEEINYQTDEDNLSNFEYNDNVLSDNFSLNDLTISIADDLDNDETLTNDELPKVDSNIMLDRLLNNGLPLIEEEKKEEEKNTYTLNDYRVFNKMLKEVREMNNSNIINIDSRLDLRLKLRYSEEEYSLFKRMIKNYSN